MFSNPITRGIERSFDIGGLVWNRLHAERETICEAMVRESQERSQNNFPLDILQTRLRKVDDALDRLFSGSYGNCSNCGKPIEQLKLGIDPATSVCKNCSDVTVH